MVTKTPNYQLIKPDQTDFYNVDDFNTNATIIDTELKKQSTKADNSWQKGVKNDVTVMNIGDSYAEKAIFFPNSSWKSSTNVEVLSITIPFDGSFSGLVRVSLATYWGGSQSHGGATLLFRIGNYVGDAPKLNSIIIENISNEFARDYYISGAVFSGTKMIIEIRKAPSAINPIAINLAVQGYATGAKGVFTATNEATVTSTDAGSPTAGGYPWMPQVSSYVTRNITSGDLTLGGNLYLSKSVPVFEMSVPNTAYSASVMLNASPSNDFGLEFRKNGEIYAVIVNKKDVRFLGHDNAWFSIQDLKLSVSNGKAAIANAITQMGIATAATAEFAVMAANILNLSNIVSGTGTITSNGTQTIFAVSGLSFKPRAIMFRAFGGNVNAWGVYNGTWVADAFIVVIGGSSYGNTFSVFQGGFNVAAAFPNGSGQFYWWAIK